MRSLKHTVNVTLKSMAYFLLGRANHSMDNFKDASYNYGKVIFSLKQAIEVNNKFAYPKYFAAQIHYLNNDVFKAKKNLHEFLKSYPESGEGHFFYAFLFYKYPEEKFNYEYAGKEFEKASIV